MPYQLYIIKQGDAPGPLFKSHWALFVHTNGDAARGQAIGTYIHVTGNVLKGFQFEVKRNWNQLYTTQSVRFVLIGQVLDSSIALWPPSTEYSKDYTARTPLERALLTEPAPGKSLRDRNAGGTRSQVLKDCQYWIRHALPHAVAQGHVRLTEGAELALSSQ